MLKKIGVNITIGILGIALGYFLFGKSKIIDVKEDIVENEQLVAWTCSMHPQIKAEESGICPLCGMDLVKSSIQDNGHSNHFSMSEEALALASVETIVVASKLEAESAIFLSGEITTNQDTDAVQTSLFEGRLDAFYKNVIGEKVRKGQKIGEVYSPQLYAGQDKLIETKIHRESHANLFDAARNTSGVWKLSDTQVEEILKSEVPLLSFPITSEFNGEIVEVYAEKGNYYKEGAPLYKVSNLRTVWAVLDAYEHHLPLLEVGNEVLLTGPGLRGGQVEATIDLIEPKFKEKKRTIGVRVVLNNTMGNLKPGMFVNAKVEIATNDRLSVPKSAVIWTGKRSIVYKKVVANEIFFELVEVELGASYEDSYEIAGGLSPGDEIVYHGAFTIDAAAQLNGKNSMITNKLEMKNSSSTREFNDDEPTPISLNEIKEETEVDKLLEIYFQFKDELVAGKYDTAMHHLQDFDSFLNHSKALDKEFGVLDGELTSIKKAKNLEMLRANFKSFNNEFIELVKAQNGSAKTVYVQFCPMADNNKGAFWLSDSEKIRNPYFGNQMLSCGLVKEIVN